MAAGFDYWPDVPVAVPEDPLSDAPPPLLSDDALPVSEVELPPASGVDGLTMTVVDDGALLSIALVGGAELFSVRAGGGGAGATVVDELLLVTGGAIGGGAIVVELDDEVAGTPPPITVVVGGCAGRGVVRSTVMDVAGVVGFVR